MAGVPLEAFPRQKGDAETEVNMLCAELEGLEAQLNEIIVALEDPNLTEQQRKALEEVYAQMSHVISDHQRSGHKGGPCFEE